MMERIPKRYSKVMTTKTKSPPKIEDPTFVAFDIEDYGIDREKTIKKGKEEEIVRYKERFPLGVTCAFFDNEGEVVAKEELMIEKWNFVDLVEWILRCLKEKGVEPTNKTLYLISHFSVAEFRHVRDWEVLPKKGGRFFIGKGNVMHLKVSLITTKGTIKVKVIDSFAYFMRGLKNIAQFVGLKKIRLDDIEGKDHEYWIEHMDEFLKRHGKEFWTYARFDSVILLKAFTRWREYFLETFDYEILNDWAPTIASVASDIFRLNYLKDEKGKPIKVAPYDWVEEGGARKVKDKYKVLDKGRREARYSGDRELRYLALRSYWGGRREAFVRGHVKKKLAILDFKAHYNRCGQTQPLPMAKTRWITTSNTRDFERIVEEGWEGFAHVDFAFPKDFSHPCLPVMSSERNTPPPRLMFPRTGEHVFLTLFELRVAKKICPNLKILKIHEARGFIPTNLEIDNPLRRFLKKLESLKNQAQREKGKNSIEYHASKLMGNSIVGKFAQKVGTWSFEDTLTMYETLGYDREALRSFLGKKRSGSLKVGSTWCPEWSSLILGRARALLGIAFSMTKPFLGHTDSLVIEYDPKTIVKVIEALKDYDAILEIETDKKGEKEVYDEAWILRASVYVFFKDGKPRKSARHGYPTTEEDFIKLIQENLKAKRGVENVVTKWSIVKPSSSFKKNLPLGSDLLRETNIDWKWDFKRKIKSYVRDCKKLEGALLWTSLVETEPYNNVKEAVKEEIRYLNKRRGIKKRKKGRPRALTQKEIKKILALKREGLTVREIARRLKKPKSTIQDNLSENPSLLIKRKRQLSRIKKRRKRSKKEKARERALRRFKSEEQGYFGRPPQRPSYQEKTKEEGWGFPSNSRKAHYFVGVRSLCGRWLFFGSLELGNDDSPDNCLACRRKLKKRRRLIALHE